VGGEKVVSDALPTGGSARKGKNVSVAEFGPAMTLPISFNATV